MPFNLNLKRNLNIKKAPLFPGTISKSMKRAGALRKREQLHKKQ
jgi:hypothetical protein